MTGTDLIIVTAFVCLFVLFIAFSDINAILHGSTVTHEKNRTMFGLYAAYT